jgi:NADH:ubiquinone oxidoreductase subunit 3 (subunit A)
LVLFLIIHIRALPFQTRDMNRLEMLSIVTIVSTLTIGLYYNTEAVNSSAALFILLFVILGINAYFLATWALKFLDSGMGKVVRKVKPLKRIYDRMITKRIDEALEEIETYKEKYKMLTAM